MTSQERHQVQDQTFSPSCSLTDKRGRGQCKRSRTEQKLGAGGEGRGETKLIFLLLGQVKMVLYKQLKIGKVYDTRSNSRDKHKSITLNNKRPELSLAQQTESSVKVFSPSFFQDMLLCNMNVIQTAVNWEFPDFCHLCKKN